MIHVFVGTKAQLIKMAPIIQELERRAIPYRFINAGQHAATIAPLIEQFGLRQPDISLRRADSNINSIAEGLWWLFGLVGQAVFQPAYVRREIFGGKAGLVLIHGDTATTLISLLLAKRAGLYVAHVEAGLRSFNILDPFPEELIRLVAMAFADLLFTPDDTAMQNLKAMHVRGDIAPSSGNTVSDTLAYARQRAPDMPAVSDYAVMSIHRFETIQSRRRLMLVIDLAKRIGAERPVRFILHGPTEVGLRRFRLLDQLKACPGVEVLPLQMYLSFAALVAGAGFVVSDGGSIQEETAALGVPCLILRSRTERADGLGRNAVLAGFDPQRIDDFLNNVDRYRFPPVERDDGPTPSARIVDESCQWLARRSGAQRA